MSQAWKHPQLGTFKLDKKRDCWVGTRSLPAFKVFKWEVKSAKAAAQHELRFRNAAGREPSAGAVKLALNVIANQSKLPSLVASTLWEEFNGRGPKSEMWWHECRRRGNK